MTVPEVVAANRPWPPTWWGYGRADVVEGSDGCFEAIEVKGKKGGDIVKEVEVGEAT